MDKKIEYYNKMRKFKEYEMIILKMSGYIADHYIDNAIEMDDFSDISSFLISYFSGDAPIDVGYLVTKYKEFGLDEKVEELDFDINEWYKLKHELEKPVENDIGYDMNDDEYIQYMIEKRKK